jgi:formylmethanofuran dehydrogenase subunit E
MVIVDTSGSFPMSDFDILFQKARKFHGHVCPGIVLGTRLTIAGLRKLGMNPHEHNRNLIVYMEIDRCGTDAVQAITGCSLGHRNMKFRDYGKFAATFVDLETRKAVRVAVHEKNRAKHVQLEMKEVIRTLGETPEEEILTIRQVTVPISDDDIPGFPRYKTKCSRCGEQIMDHREVVFDGKEVCRSCAEGAYYRILE